MLGLRALRAVPVMGYADALTQQLAILRDADYKQQHSPDAWNATDQAAQRAAKYGETYWVADNAEQLVDAGSQDLPQDAVLYEELIPSRQGFLLFEGDHGSIVSAEHGQDLAVVRGLLWDTERITDLMSGDGIVLMPLMELRWGEYAHHMLVNGAYPWEYGISLADAAARNTRRVQPTIGTPYVGQDGGVALLEVFLSLCLFLQQHLVVAASQHVDRHARRRLERSGLPLEPVVRVIQLRRIDRPADGDEHGRDQNWEWSHQWVVRGHWRQQFYPSKQINQPLWIMPYVKGPPDKPLKPPRARIFAVVR